ncbi:type IV pilus biogenesis/stability protein PilW [Pasteurellaceae bacterium USgator11]|nr:type IV pilus biogenesis/stability protein PilW [Pasteurellaceae bacterium USgator41]TNG93997.1 type IV pilus biogenesis/stability protein PilW [Pasteurellaceae bacterium UScroc12]TNG97620.1 type IV pilus biogenesis/stability protein PilW [Pasteurellaceae bacterium UScroc31]TNH00771.1 type IV pilus biogenesis/stability protein PilW [Pasteurellaceae bacterium USgator11]
MSGFKQNVAKKMTFLSLMTALLFSCVLSGCATPPQNSESQRAAYARVQVALGYLQQHQYEAAKQSLDKALQHSPDYYLPYLVSAHYYQLIGNLSQAENYYQIALQKDSKQGDAHNNYGAFLCQQGRFNDAFSHFEAALASPDYYRLAQTYENTALCAHQAHDQTRKNIALQKLAKIDQQQAEQLQRILK